jgi:DeoR/GlpR family transcriptional regulator of sugar metabolism
MIKMNRVQTRRSMMLAAERRDLLVARLRRDGKLVAKDLALELGLSEDSLRRDLRDLAAAGLCQRVYGGALPASPAISRTQARRSALAPESKRRVAARAAYLIAPGSTVILDGGTTGIAVAEALRPDLNATIVTSSPTTAAALVDHPSVEVFVLGGRLDKQSTIAFGAAAAEAAGNISADLYLLGTGGIHAKEGLTAGDPDEAAMRRILIGRAADTYVLGSLDKLGTVAPYRLAGLSDVAGIVTDAPSYHPTVQELRKLGVNIVQAS